MSLNFLNPDGTPSEAIYIQSDDPIFWCETVPPSQRKRARSLILDHRNWTALRKGELNDLLLIFPKLEEIVLPVADWGEMDTYIGTMQFTKLNKDRVVYHDEDLHIAPLDKFEYDTWAELKEELVSMGGVVLTPGDLRSEIGQVLSLAVAEKNAGREDLLVDIGSDGPRISVVGMRRVIP